MSIAHTQSRRGFNSISLKEENIYMRYSEFFCEWDLSLLPEHLFFQSLFSITICFIHIRPNCHVYDHSVNMLMESNVMQGQEGQMFSDPSTEKLRKYNISSFNHENGKKKLPAGLLPDISCISTIPETCESVLVIVVILLTF